MNTGLFKRLQALAREFPNSPRTDVSAGLTSAVTKSVRRFRRACKRARDARSRSYVAARGRPVMSARIAIEQPSESDIDAIHGVLTETYWSPGIPREVVARACRQLDVRHRA